MFTSDSVLMAMCLPMEFLEDDCCPTKFITISIHGIFPVELSADDENLNIATAILGNSIRSIQESYSKNYVMTKPQLIISPKDTTVSIKIGLLDKNIYELYLSKRKKS